MGLFCDFIFLKDKFFLTPSSKISFSVVINLVSLYCIFMIGSIVKVVLIIAFPMYPQPLLLHQPLYFLQNTLFYEKLAYNKLVLRWQRF